MNKYIIYACPTGPLAQQLEAYFAASLTLCGPNAAHKYMPHCTLTGFYPAQTELLASDIAALAAAHAAAGSAPVPPVQVLAMELRPEFHVLTLHAPWLRMLIADFAARADTPARREPLRLKDWLHLSLAYEFNPADGPQLARLAQEIVDPHAPAAWELRLYERATDWRWTCHARWTLS